MAWTTTVDVSNVFTDIKNFKSMSLFFSVGYERFCSGYSVLSGSYVILSYTNTSNVSTTKTINIETFPITIEAPEDVSRDYGVSVDRIVLNFKFEDLFFAWGSLSSDLSYMTAYLDVVVTIEGYQGTTTVGGNAVVDTTINTNAVLLGLCEGPIEKLIEIEGGSTDINPDETPNVKYGYSLGGSRKTIEQALAGASYIRSKNRRLFSGVQSSDSISFSVPYESYTSSYSLGLFSDLFDAVHSTIVLSANNELNLKRNIGDNNYIDITLDTLSTYSNFTLTTDEDIPPYKCNLFISFPQGLMRLDDQGNVQESSIVFGIQGLNSTGAVITNGVLPVDTIYESSTFDNSSSITVKITAAKRAKFDIIIPLEIVDQNVKTIRIWRETTDAGKKTDGSSDPRVLNFSVLPKYQLFYSSVKLDYPSTALLGVLFTANSQSSGSVPTVTATIHGKIIDYIPVCRPVETSETYMQIFSTDYTTPSTWDPLYYDITGAGWYKGYCTNPVWCLLDILLNKDYGLGNYISASDIDLESFFDAAKWCDDPIDYFGDGNIVPRYSLNLVLDNKLPASQVIQRILQAFRGMLFWNDGKYVLKVDDKSTVSQIFDDTQINNITQSYTAPNQIYNSMEFTYKNADDEFSTYTVYLEDTSNIVNSNNTVRTKKIMLAGTANSGQAFSLAKYNMLVNTNVTKQLSFETGLDALNADIWDVIQIKTRHMVNDSTYTAQIADITLSNTGTTDKTYLVKLATPIQIDNINSISWNWHIQSFAGNSVSIYPAIGNESYATVTLADNSNKANEDLYEIYIRLDNAAGISDLTALISPYDTFTIYGNNDTFESWRIVGIDIKSKENKIGVHCINYVDFYSELDTASISGNFRIKYRQSDLPTLPTLPGNAFHSEKVQITAEPYFDKINDITLLKVLFSIDGIYDFANIISKISVSGSRNGGPLKHLKTFTLGDAEFEIAGLQLGKWLFKITYEDGFGRTIGSINNIVRDFSNLTITSDFSTPDTNLLDISNADNIQKLENFTTIFESNYIKINWPALPEIVNKITIDYYDKASNNLITTKEYAARPIKSDGSFELIQDALEISPSIPAYKLNIKFTSIVDGSSYLYGPVFVTNQPPPAPPSTLVSFTAENSTIVITVKDSVAGPYIATVPDFKGFKGYIKIDAYNTTGFSLSDKSTMVGVDNVLVAPILYAGKVVVAFNLEYQPDGHSVQNTVVNLYEFMQNNNLESTVAELWISAVDIFDQESPQTKVGSITLATLDVKINDELIPNAFGNSLSVNLFKNSSFEGS